MGHLQTINKTPVVKKIRKALILGQPGRDIEYNC